MTPGPLLAPQLAVLAEESSFALVPALLAADARLEVHSHSILADSLELADHMMTLSADILQEQRPFEGGIVELPVGFVSVDFAGHCRELGSPRRGTSRTQT